MVAGDQIELAEDEPGGPPTARLRWRVAELRDPGIALQQGAHRAALHTAPPAVDDSQSTEALFMGRVQVVPDDIRDLGGQEAVDQYIQKHTPNGGK